MTGESGTSPKGGHNRKNRERPGKRHSASFTTNIASRGRKSKTRGLQKKDPLRTKLRDAFKKKSR